MNFSPIIILPLLGIGIGILMISLVGYLYFSSKNMDKWQVTQGIITMSGIKRSGTLLSLIFSPDIQYQYSVAGIEYKGMNLTILQKQTRKPEEAEEWIAQYPVGKQVNILYNPERHRMAVLEKGFSIKTSLLLLGPGLFLVVVNGFILLLPYL